MLKTHINLAFVKKLYDQNMQTSPKRFLKTYLKPYKISLLMCIKHKKQHPGNWERKFPTTWTSHKISLIAYQKIIIREGNLNICHRAEIQYVYLWHDERARKETHWDECGFLKNFFYCFPYCEYIKNYKSAKAWRVASYSSRVHCRDTETNSIEVIVQHV